MHKDVLKGIRWLLLKNSENLDDTRNESARLQAALELNESLATAYSMKDLLHFFWELHSKRQAEQWLKEWIELANVSGIRMLMTLAKTLQGHRSGLLAWYDYPISTGPLEGTNNKIKTMKRQAYGFRDKEFFKLKILALHVSRHKLIG